MSRRKKQNAGPLDAYRAEITRCVRCGSCSVVCPSFLADRRESRSPRGRMALIEAVLKNRLRISDVYQDRLATCTTCQACEEACASGVPVTRIIAAAREQAVAEAGAGLLSKAVGSALRNEGVMSSLAWLAPVVLHYSRTAVMAPVSGPDLIKNSGAERSSLRVKQDKKASASRMKVAFFPGCAVRHFQKDLGESVVRVLERFGFDVVIPEDLVCCGRPLLSLGDRTSSEELAAKNNEVLSGLRVDAVVTACASCSLTFKKEYPTLLAPSGAEAVRVLDIHEFLASHLDAVKFGPMDLRVTWHDPCHLGRGQGLARAARKLLTAVPGITLVEMKDPARCCGFGGVMRITHPAVSSAIGREKARDIVRTKASAVVTGCPGCMMQIRDALVREGSNISVLHTLQVLEAALAISDCRIRIAECVETKV